jgi:hypothetical protein
VKLCSVDGCETPVTNASHDLCLAHWKADKAGALKVCDNCGKKMENGKNHSAGTCYSSKGEKTDDRFLTATKLGEIVGLAAKRINSILLELGWIQKAAETTAGLQHHKAREWVELTENTIQARHRLCSGPLQSQKIEHSRMQSLESKGEKPRVNSLQASTRRKRSGFAKNSLQNLGLLMGKWSALEANSLSTIIFTSSKSPTHTSGRYLSTNDLYCDFYLPSGKVYIEYWGLEEDASYSKRKQKKLSLYESNRLNLIELKDADIENIDDNLPPKLKKIRY